MSAARFLYVNHDNPRHSGGVRTVYQHVETLNRNGYSAFAVHYDPTSKPAWYEREVPTLYSASGLALRPTDVVVIPEDHHHALHAMKNADARKILFCQNHFYIFEGLREADSWRELGINRALTCSKLMADFIQTTMGVNDVDVVQCAVDHDLFNPKPKKLQIAFMPRKLPSEAKFIQRMVERLTRDGPPVPWVEVDQMSHPRVAEVLGESAIYLSTSCREGFGLPPIEAMASGCIVAGFHGHGGLEYANESNGFWSEQLDLSGCARMVVQIINMMRENDPLIEKIIAGGRETAARFSIANQEKALLEFARRFVPACG